MRLLALAGLALVAAQGAFAQPAETYSAYEGDEIPEEAPQPLLRKIFESDVADHRWGLGVSLGAPQALRAHALFKRTARLHYVLEGEYLPVPFGSAASLSMIGADVGVRYALNDSGWYIGAGLGFWSVVYRNTAQQFQGITGIHASLQALYASPGVGWLWHLTEGFTIGSELGLQVPFYAWGEIGTTGAGNSLTTSLQESSREFLAHYGFLILPRVTLIRLSWILP